MSFSPKPAVRQEKVMALNSEQKEDEMTGGELLGGGARFLIDNMDCPYEWLSQDPVTTFPPPVRGAKRRQNCEQKGMGGACARVKYARLREEASGGNSDTQVRVSLCDQGNKFRMRVHARGQFAPLLVHSRPLRRADGQLPVTQAVTGR